MKEYIERSSVMDALQDIPSGCIGEPCNVGLRYARAQIAAIPAADVVEVRHGRWIGEIDDRDGHIWMECSECHKVRIIDEYCSACGARMDKEDEHD